jgi:hypothetical protein
LCAFFFSLIKLTVGDKKNIGSVEVTRNTHIFLFGLIRIQYTKYLHVAESINCPAQIDIKRSCGSHDRMVGGFTTTYTIGAYHHWCCKWFSIRARCTTLCDKVYQWLATGQWFSPGIPDSSTNKNWQPRYNWNIVENGIKHHNPKPKTKLITWFVHCICQSYADEYWACTMYHSF